MLDLCTAANARENITMTTTHGSQRAAASGQRDFDFFYGSWTVKNRRLRSPLSGSTDWYEFDSTATARPVWNGLAQMDEFVAPETPVGPIYGMTVRLFNPQSGQWSMNWASAKSAAFGPPTVGSFENGRGEFFDQEVFEGRSIFVRYVWSDITADSCRWEQSFSADGGKTWETNWTMAFSRVQA